MKTKHYQPAYIQHAFADRIGGSSYGKGNVLYKFEKIKRAKAIAKQQQPHVELIDMGVGEPDEMAAADIVATLAKEAAKPENRGYADNGVTIFKQAAVEYLRNVFHVDHVDAEREVLHSIGSKSALAMIPSCFINSGDITIMTVPGYPVIGTHTKYLGGEVYTVPLTAENHFLPDLYAIPAEICRKAKLLYLNYPNNPTGAVATVEFFKQAIAWAKQYEVIIVHDAPYAALTYNGYQPLSFLSVAGAKEVGVELHSLSKSHNMTGWRIGFIAGNSLVVKAFGDVKDNNDSGQFIAIQKAAAYGLAQLEIPTAISAKYSRRFDMLVQALNQVGFQAKKPYGSFFLYVRAPKAIKNGMKFKTGEEFSQYLIREHCISTVPWDEVGRFIRFSVTFQAQDQIEEQRIISELQRRLMKVEYVF